MKKQRLSDQVAAQLEGMIAEGTLKPGERLPAERQLAERLGISRPSLREAIQKLASKGLIKTRQGGGSYIAEGLTHDFSSPLIAVLKDRPDAEFDTLEVRKELEGMAAYHAAMRATDEDREHISASLDRMLEAHRAKADSNTKFDVDHAFHMSIVEAAHNIVLTHFMRGLKDVLETTVSIYLDAFYADPEFVEQVCQQHKNIVQAILDRNPDAARAAAVCHLDFAYRFFRDFQTKNRLSESAKLYASMYDENR
ncbi:FadR/GntR family transcriptional regulator [Solemya velum gill symbiont]|uniref:FadR/GntR family transcriptional regulator n=1 Tax=Solemya velum gill symbiont TaxID=2340 RepID=UPI0009975981|nr:FCD domain-containing protein [Solemya velum gill symbiont]OOY50629.1 hypothetical protein BOV97_10515 [Solemya velum gill symbiont]OOY54794.1 hypothetical protein BOV99_09710 [Solemya velum gill symbiont]OOY55503.1 hypothetical protein BOW00_09715 [Solemya velum gill symbiont]OOY59322.1 hypothetical protein BOW02_09915 [Solemya velum gill symbiont]OOY61054.1 hypothetical protein BOW04_09610 [Solemya velum gill symbiont]